MLITIIICSNSYRAYDITNDDFDGNYNSNSQNHTILRVNSGKRVNSGGKLETGQNRSNPFKIGPTCCYPNFDHLFFMFRKKDKKYKKRQKNKKKG